MQICMVTSAHFPPIEGMGIHIWNLSQFLIDHGHDVQIITRGGMGKTRFYSKNGISIWRVPFLPVYPFHVHLQGIFVAPLVEKILTEVDIFHIHSPLSPVLSTERLIMLTFHSTVPEDVSLTPMNSFYSLLMKLQSPVSYRLECEHLKNASKVNVISPRTVEIIRRYPGCPKNIDVIWNGVNTCNYSPDWELPRDKKIVLTVSRLAPGKGIEDLIHAATLVIQQDPSFHFLIAGDGVLKNSLHRKIHESNFGKNITLLGHISDQASLLRLYREALLFVLPSYHEGIPTVLLEAMSCGCPVVSTKVGGIPQFVEHGKNGILISPNQPKRLAEIILSSLDNPVFLNNLGKQARQTVEERFSWEIIGQRYLDQYINMIN